MEYCCLHQKGGAYIELQEGDYEQRSLKHHWLDTSLYLEDEIFQELSLYYLFSQVIPRFDTFGVTKINSLEWEQIKEIAPTFGSRVQEAIAEIDVWVEACFLKEDCFTVLGI